MTVLLLAEQKDGHLNDVTARALTAARQMGEPVHVLVTWSVLMENFVQRRRKDRKLPGRMISPG